MLRVKTTLSFKYWVTAPHTKQYHHARILNIQCWNNQYRADSRWSDLHPRTSITLPASCDSFITAMEWVIMQTHKRLYRIL